MQGINEDLSEKRGIHVFSQDINLDAGFIRSKEHTLRAMGTALDLFLSDYCGIRVSGSTVVVTHPAIRKRHRFNLEYFIGEYLIKAPGFWKKKSINHVLESDNARHVKAIKAMICIMERERNIKVYASFNRYESESPTREYNVSLMVYAC